MAKNTSVAIGNHFRRFIDRQVKHGRFGSTSEVIRAGLRLLEEREAKLEALRVAIQEGIDSGPAEAFDFDDFVSRKESLEKDAELQAASQSKKRPR